MDGAHAARRARLQLLVSGLCFGLMAVLVRVASSGPGCFTGGQTSLLRFAIGLAFCLTTFRLRPAFFVGRNYRLLAARGLFGGASVVLYFQALALIPAGDATLLNNLHPILSTILAAFLVKELPTLRLASALLVTAAGVWLVLGRGGLTIGLGFGELAGMISGFFAAIAVVVIRALRSSGHSAITVFTSFCLGGFLVSIPLAGGAWPTSSRVWAVGLAAGVVAVVAQMLMTNAYGALTVPEAAIWQQLTPVVSYLFALPLLDERLSSLAAVGVLMVLAGVAWGASAGARTAKRPSGVQDAG